MTMSYIYYIMSIIRLNIPATPPPAPETYFIYYLTIFEPFQIYPLPQHVPLSTSLLQSSS
jgi:hypothetical protein